MIRTYLTPIILLIVAGALFFLYTDPAYSRVEDIRAEESEYDAALSKSRELQRLRDSLLNKYNAFDQSELGRLRKMLPDNVDNVRLIMEMDGIASQYGMLIRDVVLRPGSEMGEETVAERQSKEYETIDLEFKVNATYDDFVSFLADLERSLRLVDIERIRFKSSEVDFNEYTVVIRTYWVGS